MTINEIILRINPKAQDYFEHRHYSFDKFCEAINNSENIAKYLGCSSDTLSKYTKDLFPDKPKGRLKFWILAQSDYKECKACNTIKSRIEFYDNASTSDCLNGYCKVCQSKQTAKTQSGRQANYNSSKIQRTPRWANLELIKNFYNNTPSGYHVDHYYPLNGVNVSGLHTLENLQYLPALDNIRKSNKIVV